MRLLAVVGLTLVSLMQVFFALTGGDRPFPYREVQVLSVLGTLAMAWGAWRGERVAFAVGAAVDLLTRALQPILGLTRLPLWANLLLMAGWTWTALDAARGKAPRAGLWLLAGAHFLSALTAEARLSAFVALCVGAVGLSLAAPNVGALTASPDTREGRSG